MRGQTERRQIIVIGAGPAGSIAAALLKLRGRDVLVLEKERFPRFSIGESLLVHCLDFVEEAGMLPAVQRAGFQSKNGAAFARGSERDHFDFAEGFTAGKTSTYEVQRATFDKVLADEAAAQGVEIRYETEMLSVRFAGGKVQVTARSADGSVLEVEADFILDASGFGRTLPRLLNLERPSSFPVRQAVFTHVEDRISIPDFDRNKILITVHPRHQDVWYWLIPFSNGRCSLGVVARQEFLASYPGSSDVRLRAIVNEDAGLTRLLADAHWDTPARAIGGYAANVTAMQGPGFALLGNAAEFLDPVFSSGVTIAMRSASMAAHCLDRQLDGEAMDWTTEFERPLRRGVECFRAFVEAWYDGRFQTIIFSERKSPEIRRMICSVLAGYAWDESNPFVCDARRRIDVVAQLCAA